MQNQRKAVLNAFDLLNALKGGHEWKNIDMCFYKADNVNLDLVKTAIILFDNANRQQLLARLSGTGRTNSRRNRQASGLHPRSSVSTAEQDGLSGW